MEDFKDNFVDALIEAVKAESSLYDKKHPDYFRKSSRTRTFEAIGKKVGRDSVECEKRWKLVREKFARVHKDVQSAVLLDSRAIEEVKWPYYFQLSFLKRHIMKRKPRNSSTKYINEQARRRRRALNLSPECVLSDPIDHREKIRKIERDISEDRLLSDYNNDDSENEGDGDIDDELSEVAIPTISKKAEVDVLYNELKNAISAFNKSLNADDDDENFVRHVCSMMRPLPMKQKDKLRGLIYEMVLNARKDLHK